MRIITTQAEYDALPKILDDDIEIRSTKEHAINISWTPKNSKVHVSGSATIQHVSGSATIQYVSGSATIQSVYGSATIQSVYGSATIQYVSDSATIQYVSDSATIQYVSGSATIQYVSDSATIQHVSGSATIQYVSGSATIQYVSGSATIQHVYGSATIQYVSGSATIQHVYGNAQIVVHKKTVTILRAAQQAIIIAMSCVLNISKMDTSVAIVHRSQALHDAESISEIFQLKKIDDALVFYKSVTDDHMDFWSKTIKYEGHVVCPDWDPSPVRQCGGGLHVSPTKKHALSYNKGKVLKVLVRPENLVIYQADLSKVRCRELDVIGETE